MRDEVRASTVVAVQRVIDRTAVDSQRCLSLTRGSLEVHALEYGLGHQEPVAWMQAGSQRREPATGNRGFGLADASKIPRSAAGGRAIRRPHQPANGVAQLASLQMQP